MAEAIVGLAASSISIATLVVQITNSIAKLKSYWDQLNEAPEDIRLLMEELEDIHLLLLEIEDDQRWNPFSSTILERNTKSRCLEHCRRAADSLKTLTDELEVDFNLSNKLKSKWASAKVVLKKDKIEKYRLRLERSIRLLSLSQQCYTRSVFMMLIPSKPQMFDLD